MWYVGLFELNLNLFLTLFLGSCCGGKNCLNDQFESQCSENRLFSTGSCDDTCGNSLCFRVFF